MIALALCVAGCSGPVTEPATSAGALLTVIFPSHGADTLIVLVSDSATIVQAERFVRTGSGPAMLSGRIVRGAGSDPRYLFHFIPESVRLVDAGMEICDGAPMRSASDVSQFFEWSTGRSDSDSAPWCPWGSRPIAVRRP